VGEISRLQVWEGGRHRPEHPNSAIRSEGIKNVSNGSVRTGHSSRRGSRRIENNDSSLSKTQAPIEEVRSRTQASSSQASAQGSRRSDAASSAPSARRGEGSDSSSASPSGRGPGRGRQAQASAQGERVARRFEEARTSRSQGLGSPEEAWHRHSQASASACRRGSGSSA